MKTVIVRCSYCNNPFERKKGQHKEALKFGWRQFCSLKCRDKIREKRVEKICDNPSCKKIFTRVQGEIKKNKSGKFYCSTSCAAIINNSKRKNKLPDHPCSYCGESTHWVKKYCSVKCSSYSRKMTQEQFRNNVINKIQKFYFKKNRIPTKREMYGTYGTARNVFGTWNKAIETAGFKSNPVMFANHYRALDGHKCDSFTEKIIDDWLFENKIDHKIHVPYPNFPEFKSDFLINDTFVEFFGLEGQHKKYSELAKQKRELAKKFGIKLIELYPNDIYPKNKLGFILGNLIK